MVNFKMDTCNVKMNTKNSFGKIVCTAVTHSFDSEILVHENTHFQKLSFLFPMLDTALKWEKSEQNLSL